MIVVDLFIPRCVVVVTFGMFLPSNSNYDYQCQLYLHKVFQHKVRILCIDFIDKQKHLLAKYHI